MKKIEKIMKNFKKMWKCLLTTNKKSAKTISIGASYLALVKTKQKQLYIDRLVIV